MQLFSRMSLMSLKYCVKCQVREQLKLRRPLLAIVMKRQPNFCKDTLNLIIRSAQSQFFLQTKSNIREQKKKNVQVALFSPFLFHFNTNNVHF
jgi:hypothetical protein